MPAVSQAPAAPPGPDDSAKRLPGVGPRRVRLFARLLGLADDLTISDLLTLYPRDHQDRRRLTLVRDLIPGTICTFYGQLKGPAQDRRTPTGKTVTQVLLTDGSGTLYLRWFNQPFLKKKLSPGDKYIVTGKVERFGAETSVTQPELEKLETEELLSGGRIVPIYPLTEGLQQPAVRTAIRQALDVAAKSLPEFLPEWLRKNKNLPPVGEAIENIHFPKSPEALNAAQRRLKFEELFLLQAYLAIRRLHDRSRPGIKLKIDEPIAAEIRRMMPFEPTGAQKQVVREIFRDLVRPNPMNRLLQGDVGSGKTIVACIAVVAVVRNGCQAAVMAPTEILAEQHAATFRRLLEPLGIPVHLLTGSVGSREREAVLSSLQWGEPGLAVGTHALIQEGVQFHRLALAIVDEQHRFGVEQRLKLQQQGGSGEDPHVLVMTATPIPRTLSLTAYGHLDISTINELPPGRTPIKTHWVSQSRRDEVYQFVRDQVKAGQQAYIVCSLVEDSEKLDAVSALSHYEYLQRSVFPDLRVGLVHGKMRSLDKDAVMEQFRTGDIEVLTATTVIEVGVDVPNATVMVIEDANRFGLAQLHQLRGRVGRGEHKSSCFLITDDRLNPARTSNGALILDEESDAGQRRMRVLVESCDGFRIAEEDFNLRGVGLYFGTAQHGRSRLRIADLHKDFLLLKEAREAASELILQDPALEAPEHRLLRHRLADLHIEYDIDEDYSSIA